MASRLSYSFWATMPDERLFDWPQGGKLLTTPADPGRGQPPAGAPEGQGRLRGFWRPVVEPGAGRLRPEGEAAEVHARDGQGHAGGDRRVPRRPLHGAWHHREDGASSSPRPRPRWTGRWPSIYGISGVTGTSPAPVTLDSKQRAGLFTQLGFLTCHGGYRRAPPTRPSAARSCGGSCAWSSSCPRTSGPGRQAARPRGVTTRAALREALEECLRHLPRMIDPIGFAFEGYDAIGRLPDHRQRASRSTPAARCQLGRRQLTFKDAVELMNQLASSPRCRTAWPRSGLRYMLRREEAKARHAVAGVPSEGVQEGSTYDMRELLVAIDQQRCIHETIARRRGGAAMTIWQMAVVTC